MSEPKSRLSRRTLFAGAGTAGVLAAAATVVSRVAPPVEATAPTKPAPEKGGGYQLSEHVQRYYKTTRI